MFNQYPYINENDLNLDYLLKKIKDVFKFINDLESWKTQHEAEYQQLKDFYDAVMSGNFPPSLVAAFNDWMSRNALDLVGELVHMVFFGLTDDGYFVAYIPQGWSDIMFGTSGYDDFPVGVDYGHLTLTY